MDAVWQARRECAENFARMFRRYSRLDPTKQETVRNAIARYGRPLYDGFNRHEQLQIIQDALFAEEDAALSTLVSEAQERGEYRHDRPVITPEMAKNMECPFKKDEDL